MIESSGGIVSFISFIVILIMMGFYSANMLFSPKFFLSRGFKDPSVAALARVLGCVIGSKVIIGIVMLLARPASLYGA